MKKIVVFGGSFNPPTLAHLKLGQEIVKNLKDIEKVIYVPLNDAYRKKDLAPGVHRFEMTKLLLKNEANLEVTDSEIKSPIYVCTYDTLKEIKSQYEDRDIYLLIGSDKLGQLRKWKNIKGLLQEFKILLISRNNGAKMELLEEHPTFNEYKNSFEVLNEIEEVNISSTMIRENITSGISITNLTKDNIIEYIKANNLYIK